MTGSVLEKEARDRQGSRNDIVEIFPPSENGKTRDKLGELPACPVCNHTHRRFIEVLLLESPHPLKRIAMFYEISEEALKHHRNHCMKITIAQLV